MKQIFSVLSIIVLSAFMTISCSSDDKNVKESSEDKQKDFECEYYRNCKDYNNKNVAVIISCLDKKAQKITLPTKVMYDGEEYEVMFIRDGAFEDCDNLTSIILPDSLRMISSSTFRGCYDKIKEIYLPDNLLLSKSAMDCLSNLQRYLVSDKNKYHSAIDGVLFNKEKNMILRFPKGRGGAYSIPNGVSCIGGHAFDDCIKLTSIDIPGSVKSIGGYAFYECKGLSNINISDGVEKIELRAFDGVENCEKIHIPKSVNYIESYAFNYVGKLKEFIVSEDNMHYSSENGVLFNKNKTELIKCPRGKTGTYTIPNSVEYLTKSAFSFCSLDSINLPSNLESIEDDVFSVCKELTSITIPEGVTAIGNMAFLYCEKLVSVNLPNSLERIGEESFSGCNSLEQIYIPANVMYIDPIAFWYSGNIKEFVVSEENKAYSSTDDGLLLDKSKTKLLKIPSAKRVCYVPAYIKEIVASGDLLDSFVVSEENENYSSIDGVLFDKMKKVLIECPGKKTGCYTIPDGVNEISEYAFDRSKLKSITIPASVFSIEDRAIYYCKKLEAVNVSENNKHYSSENGVLFNKRKTKMIKYPEAKKGVCELPNSTVSVDFHNGNFEFESIVIPEWIRHIGEYKTLVWCDSLKSITIKAEKFTEEVDEIFRSVNADKVTIYVPEACIENYKQRAKGFNHITSVPLKIKAIGKND